ncbi:Phosphopantetheine attachment site [Micromonospora echinaurantiaca]|uniref:Phosphopantetheine attachment site n=1 Tax=Micromonospora echinaurantiaca TaxID=47857 RepID=A0A1C5IHR5_9ACTN|nr:phosphopantetheine-binding protein [Micromonospora echinaurantiaca]SCG57897.1 Phosphopantetheine attachment site [Micromonospora echinaurantiaca]
MTDISAEVAAVWCELLRSNTIDADDNFFALGGDSMDAVVLIQHLVDNFGVELSVADVFRDARFSAVVSLVQQRVRLAAVN